MSTDLTVRASELNRIFLCNGSLTAVPLVPEREGDDGIEGEVIHFQIASRLVTELGAVPPDGGLKAPSVPTSYKLPAFSAWIVDWAVRHVRETVPPTWSLMVELPLAYRYKLPRPVTMTDPDGRPILVTHVTISGHQDYFALSPDATESDGGDWKTGPIGASPAETNWQAAGYLGLDKRAWPTLKKSRFTLAQPRIDEDIGVPRISTVELEGDALDGMNDVLAERLNLALENRLETNSGIAQCKYCPVGWRCPSIQADLNFMKATLTPQILAELAKTPSDAALGDFVATARTLTKPIDAAEDLLHERIDAVGYVDAGCGTRITRTTQPGTYEVPDPIKFMTALRLILPQDNQIAMVMKPQMGRIQDEIAKAMNLPKTSKNGDSAASVFSAHLRPLTEQKQKRMLQFT